MAAAATARPSLEFPDQKIGLPPLSLANVTPPGAPNRLNDSSAWLRPSYLPRALSDRPDPKIPLGSPGANSDSKMVKVPDPSIDYKLIIKSPDSSIDYKLIVIGTPKDIEPKNRK